MYPPIVNHLGPFNFTCILNGIPASETNMKIKKVLVIFRDVYTEQIYTFHFQGLRSGVWVTVLYYD